MGIAGTEGRKVSNAGGRPYFVFGDERRPDYLNPCLDVVDVGDGGV